MTTERATLLAAVAKPDRTYTGTVTKIEDGDTIQVTVKAWAKTPFDPIDLRIAGIDAPETRMPPGKCALELQRGEQAKAYINTIVKAGDVVRFKVTGLDKYGRRVDAKVTLPNKTDLATVMLASGLVRPYSGGTKSDWCTP